MFVFRVCVLDTCRGQKKAQTSWNWINRLVSCSVGAPSRVLWNRTPGSSPPSHLSSPLLFLVLLFLFFLFGFLILLPTGFFFSLGSCGSDMSEFFLVSVFGLRVGRVRNRTWGRGDASQDFPISQSEGPQELWSSKFLGLMMVCVFLSYIVSWVYCFTIRFSLSSPG